MRRKHQKTLEAIFARPVSASLAWRDIEMLFGEPGAEISEREGTGPGSEVIEACRKADWIDASKGLLRKGVSRATIKAVETAFPNLGFHDSLLRLAKEYGGSTVAGGIKVARGIVKW